LYIADITWADGDTTGDVPHGLVGTPLSVVITPTAQLAATTVCAATTVDATKVTLTKLAGGAGGGAASALRLVVSRPHSIIR
jgi:hypothetical protein